jgi:hypothetical protein
MQRAVFMDPASPRPFLSPLGVHLPADFAQSGLTSTAQAALAHAAAHQLVPRTPLAATGRKPLTRALIGCLEDARAEAVLGTQLPGLLRLWRSQHTSNPTSLADAESLIARLSRALLDPDYADPHPWITKGRELFARGVTADDDLCRVASLLGNDLGQQRLPFNDRTYLVAPAYRDDHRWLWQDLDPQEHALSAGASGAGQAITVRDSGEPPPPPAGTGITYPEWDQRIRRRRPAWTTVHQRRALAEHAPVPRPPARLAQLLRSLLPRVRSGHARGDQGDDLDPAALCDLGIAWRIGLPGDPRVWRQPRPQPRTRALLILIDASASSGDGLAGAPVLSSATATARTVAQASRALGLPCAVHAFASAGRHLVEFREVVAAHEPWDASAEARLAGVRSAGSTRLGAAIRHATHLLAEHAPAPRHVLLLSDGEAHDIDVHEPAYLAADAADAVLTAQSRGVEIRLLRLGERDLPRWLGHRRWRPFRGPAHLAQDLAQLV